VRLGERDLQDRDSTYHTDLLPMSLLEARYPLRRVRPLISSPTPPSFLSLKLTRRRFFAFHPFPSLQAFYPVELTPQILKDLMNFYISITNDPTMQVSAPFIEPFLLFLRRVGSLGSLESHLSPLFLLPYSQGVLGLTGAKPMEFLWFKSLLYLEAIFQLPIFFIGAYGLFHNSRRVWPLLVIYGASTATTLLPVLAMVLAAPGENGGKESLTVEQRGMLLASYLPFLFLPVSTTFTTSGWK